MVGFSLFLDLIIVLRLIIKKKRNAVFGLKQKTDTAKTVSEKAL